MIALVYASGCALTTLAVLASVALDGPALLRDLCAKHVCGEADAYERDLTTLIAFVGAMAAARRPTTPDDPTTPPFTPTPAAPVFGRSPAWIRGPR